MRVSRNIFSLGAASLLLTGGAVAAGASKGTLHLFENVTVQGKQLAPGDYKVEWNGEGPNVQLSIEQGKQTVVSVPARVTPVNEKNPSDGYASKQEGGQNVLSEVFFHGKTFELEIGNQAAAAPSQPATNGSNR
jgi:hypothetical protein